MARKGHIREEFYSVTVLRDAVTGQTVGESWETELKPSPRPGAVVMGLHREEGPARFDRDPETGVITWEDWYNNGLQHRQDGPAHVERDRISGIITCEEWRSGGRKHRDNGPAEIIRDATTGVTVLEAWWRHGKRHRIDGPAAIYRRPTGEITYRLWFMNGTILPRRLRRMPAQDVTPESPSVL